MAEKALQELLLRRKELAAKVAQLSAIKPSILTEIKQQRVEAREGFSDLNLTIPRVTMADFTSEFDWYSRQLREVDALIQNANWTTKIPNADHLFESWPRQEIPKVEVSKK